MFSIGAIMGGHSTYINGSATYRIATGAVVAINPEVVHACRPLADEAWSYRMLYVDASWLASLQQTLGTSRTADFQPLTTHLTTEPALYEAFNRFYEILTDKQIDPLHKHSEAVLFFSEVLHSLIPATHPSESLNGKLRRAAAFISDNCTRSLKLEEICAEAALSPSYLIRAFKKRYGMTPHAYLINRRIQYSRARLRQGRPITEVAHEAGFADQAHFQRSFKQFVAATPRQYRDAPGK